MLGLGGAQANNVNNFYADTMFLNNHVDITVRYHESIEFTGARIVGVQVCTPPPPTHTSTFNLPINHARTRTGGSV